MGALNEVKILPDCLAMMKLKIEDKNKEGRTEEEEQ